MLKQLVAAFNAHDPGKPGYRRIEVLALDFGPVTPLIKSAVPGLDLSGNPTYRELPRRGSFF